MSTLDACQADIPLENWGHQKFLHDQIPKLGGYEALDSTHAVPAKSSIRGEDYTDHSFFAIGEYVRVRILGRNQHFHHPFLHRYINCDSLCLLP